MGLIEDQRQHIEAEVKQARQSARRAEREAEAERSKYFWGKNNPAWNCLANLHLLEGYLANAGIEISNDSLDLAFRACRNTLAERVLTPVVPELTAAEKREAENNRLRSLSVSDLRAEVQANIKRKLATPEYGGYGSTYVPPFTASEFARMSPSKVRTILYYEGSNQERPGVRAGIDLLLRNAQLLKEAKSV
jgi:hypothetical protein